MIHAVALLVLLADGPWRTLSNEDGFLLEAQDVEGSSYERLRVTFATKASPEVFAKALWGKASDMTSSPEVTHREVLIDEERVRRYHDLVQVSIVSDRDYVMHETMTDHDGAWTLTFDSVDDARAPKKAGVVRMPKIEGRVIATPNDSGGAKIVYTNLTEAGGAIPAVLTRGSARKAALTWVKEIRRRAEEPKPK